MNLKVWALVVLGGMGVSGLALALGAPIIPAKLAFWGVVLGILAWRRVARAGPPIAAYGSAGRPTNPARSLHRATAQTPGVR